MIVSIGEILFDCFIDEKVLGGAPFNFFYHIKKLSGNAEFISKIGDDENGKAINDFLSRNKINSKYIQIDDTHPTGIVNVIVDDAGIPAFDIVLNCAYDFIELDSEIAELLNSQTTLLYFGTLAQRNSVSRQTIQSLFGKNIKYFCDLNLRGNYYSNELLYQCLKAANVLKLNEDELKIVSEQFLLGYSDNLTSANLLIKKFEIELISITLGERGALILDRKSYNENKHTPNKIIDTVGAGDAYSAILCLGYLNKLPLERINYLANKFASDICEIKGAIPKTDEIYSKFKKELMI